MLERSSEQGTGVRTRETDSIPTSASFTFSKMERYDSCRYSLSNALIPVIVLMWETVIETLLDNEFVQKNGNDEDAAAAAHLVRRFCLCE